LARIALAPGDVISSWISGAGRKGMGVATPGDHHEGDHESVAKLVKDEQGGEVLEYALIAGLIVVAAIAVIGAVGTKVVARWTSLTARCKRRRTDETTQSSNDARAHVMYFREHRATRRFSTRYERNVMRNFSTSWCRMNRAAKC